MSCGHADELVRKMRRIYSRTGLVDAAACSRKPCCLGLLHAVACRGIGRYPYFVSYVLIVLFNMMNLIIATVLDACSAAAPGSHMSPY